MREGSIGGVFGGFLGGWDWDLGLGLRGMEVCWVGEVKGGWVVLRVWVAFLRGFGGGVLEREREALFWWVGGRKGVFDWGVEGRGWASVVRISSGDVRGKLRRTGELLAKLYFLKRICGSCLP